MPYRKEYAAQVHKRKSGSNLITAFKPKHSEASLGLWCRRWLLYRRWRWRHWLLSCQYEEARGDAAQEEAAREDDDPENYPPLGLAGHVVFLAPRTHRIVIAVIMASAALIPPWHGA